jgi:hypothetical protein
MDKLLPSLQLLLYVGLHIALLFVAAFVICGWFGITRGRIETLVDGTEEKHGKIFMGWYFFWHRTQGKKRIYHSGYGLDKFAVNAAQHHLKLERVIVGCNSPGYMKCCDATEDSIQYWHSGPISTEAHVKVREHLKAHLIETPIGEGNYPPGAVWVSPYVEENDYVFPEWLRDVMAGCITCHSSVYGTLFFALFHLLVGKDILQAGMYAPFAASFVWVVLATWIVFCISLAYLTTVLYKKFN